ncbi:ATP-binding protein [Candidatus Micrarchaeota archaeon]|nr:ATP-binding protein [Candidatus Micrarchaeota archaeon]
MQSMKNEIKKIILEFQQNGIPDFISRETKISSLLKTGMALIITGPRRAGKSYLMFQLMKETKLPMEQIVYINFEDNRLAEFNYKNFEDIIDAYKELSELKPVFFLDEIHIIDKWWLFIRRLVDQKYVVCITGSNAKLLSKEYATHLAGRGIEHLQLPLTFTEYLKFKKIKKPDKNILFSNKRFEINNLFKDYLIYGGFPSVVLSEENQKKILNSYFNTVVYRDIITRYNITDEGAFNIFLKKLAENIGNPFKYAGIERLMHQVGLDITRKTLINYSQYANNAFFIFKSIDIRSSVKRREMERKIYLVDNGYLHLFYSDNDLGKPLENAVAIWIYNHYKELNYFRENEEIDFILPNGIPIQVCCDTTNEREIKSLLKYMEYSKQKKGYIITLDEDKIIKENNIEIHILPAYYAFLYPENILK